MFKKIKFYFLDILLLIMSFLIESMLKLSTKVVSMRQFISIMRYKKLINNIVTLEDLYKKFATMSKDELTMLLYVQTDNMRYKDMRANKIKFLKIDEKYYINYELLFFNILQIIQPHYKEFAIKHFSYVPVRNSISFDEDVIEEFYYTLCDWYGIEECTCRREYKILSIKNLYFKENLLEIPKEIAHTLKGKGVSFKDAICEKNSSNYRDCKFFNMSYKYIILRDNVP